MTGKQLKEEFRRMLGEQNKLISEYVRIAKDGEQMRWEHAKYVADRISGIAYAAYRLGVIDWDEMVSIEDAAFNAANGKEPEYEAC